jgi:hypothetical protein
MGGTAHTHGRRRWAYLAVLTLAVIGLLGAVAPAALAVDPIDVVCDDGNNTMHGDGVINTSCLSCHATTDYYAPIDTAKCLVCHLGGYENRSVESDFDTCWSCHYPGENQDVVQTSDGCAAEGICHPVDAASNEPHFGANTKGCVDGCHRTSAQSTPNGSPHHDDGKANCYDCHDGVRALEKVHEPYAEARDYDFGGPYPYCYTCHVGYEETHPDPAAIVHRTTLPAASPQPVVYGGTTVISGVLYTVAPDGTKIRVVGKAVSLFQYRVPEFDWNTLQLTLTLSENTATTALEAGKYIFSPVQPVKNTRYAALVKGEEILGTGMYAKPARGVILVKVAPIVTESLNKTSFALGGSITVTGKVKPWKTGGKVKWVFQRKIDGVWKTVTTTGTRLLTDVDVADPGVDYSKASYTYKPGKKGYWRVKTTFVATTEYTTRSSVYKTFTVK